jgi:hypothetical protein
MYVPKEPKSQPKMRTSFLSWPPVTLAERKAWSHMLMGRATSRSRPALKLPGTCSASALGTSGWVEPGVREVGASRSVANAKIHGGHALGGESVRGPGGRVGGKVLGGEGGGPKYQ